MIVIGVDVHKHVLTAVAVDALGRELARWSGPVADSLLDWARSLEDERRWALEDCRHVSRGLERMLLEAGEPLVRVPPRLTAPARRRGRARGKSDAIDALAVARAALREPGLDHPRRIARQLLVRCRASTREIVALERELEARAQTLAPRLLELPGCGPLSAAKLLSEIGPIERFANDARLARHAGVAPLEASSGKQRRHRLDRGGNRQLNCALHRIAVTQGRVYGPARAYLERKQAEGKSRREALRCLKRQLARTVYSTLRAQSALT